jgi:3-isopropylmalate dehydrogenase
MIGTLAAVARRRPLLGVLPGEGIGPEVMAATLAVVDALRETGVARLEVQQMEPVWRADGARALSPEVAAFFERIFAADGVVLCGPVGGRFVYELRRHFDLFCKLVPIVVPEALHHAGRLRPEFVRGVDILLVRENIGGLYQGHETLRGDADDRAVEVAFSYREADVRRVVDVAAELARTRRGELQVVVKRAGVSAVSDLWIACAEAAAARVGVRCAPMDIDYAAYHLIQHAQRSDVIVTPNLFGDVLSDLGAVLMGSRGVGFSANFAANGAGVYQTTHGAAFDLAGTGRSNPAAQIRSLAMLLRTSLGLDTAAAIVEGALAEVWRSGWTTDDLAVPGARAVETERFGALVADAVRRTAEPGR